MIKFLFSKKILHITIYACVHTLGMWPSSVLYMISWQKCKNNTIRTKQVTEIKKCIMNLTKSVCEKKHLELYGWINYSSEITVL
jgi:hypothetical protein